MERTDPTAAGFVRAVESGDAAALRKLFAEHPELSAALEEPWFSFGGLALGEAAARGHHDVVDALIDLGSDLDGRSHWKNGPYSALHRLVDGATPERLALADHIASRGATVDLHAAAGMGRLDRLGELLDADPGSVNDPGPDGATALHLAKDASVAELLIERGADVDQRCIDHKSTPAMWAAGSREDVVRVLLDRGATPDLYLAALMDDVDMARRILEKDPDAIHVRVRFGASHPHVGYGDKYVWTLDGAETPVELARVRDKKATYAFLLEKSPDDVKLVQASRRGDTGEIERLLDLPVELSEGRTCEALCGSAEGADALLRRGASPNARDDRSRATALHHAAWRGLSDVVTVLLDHDADAYLRDRDHDATPLGWAHEAGHTAIVKLIRERRPPDIVDAAWLGDADRIREILAEDPTLAHGLDNGRLSPLRSAAWHGRVDVVRVLLEHGAEPGAPHPVHRKTAIDFARERGHTEILELLMSASRG